MRESAASGDHAVKFDVLLSGDFSSTRGILFVWLESNSPDVTIGCADPLEANSAGTRIVATRVTPSQHESHRVRISQSLATAFFGSVTQNSKDFAPASGEL